MGDYFGKLGTDEADVLLEMSYLVEKVVTAQNTADHNLFVTLFDEEGQSELKPEDFMTPQNLLEANFGEIVKTEFLCSLKRQNKPWFIYRLKFDRTEDDKILTLIINDEDKNHRAAGIWIS